MYFLRTNRTPLNLSREARAVLVVLLTLTMVLVPNATAAWSFWTGPSSGTGSASAGTLQPPLNVIVPATSTGTVALSWTAAAGTPPPTGYYVIRARVSDGQTAAACGTGPAATTSGVSCNDLSVPDGTFTYTVTSVYRTWTATSAVSSTSVVVTSSTATKLAFTTSPSGSTGGTAFGTQPVVTIQDAGGNTTTSTASVTLAISGSPTGVTLSCTANPQAAVAGVATFAGCKIDKAGSYTLTATSGTLTAATSASVTITVGLATKLAFTTSPSNGTRNVDFTTQPVVTVQDAGGNTVTAGTGSTASVTLTSSGGNLKCDTSTLTASAIAGVATFAGCDINQAGTYTLTAAATGLTSAVSATFIISGNPSQLAFTTNPSGSTGGIAFGTQPVVAVQDSGGRTTAGTDTVTLSITGSPTGITLTCMANPQTAVAGVATFAGCNINKPGTYTLTATSSGLTSALSTSFTISVGSPTKLTFTTSPSNSNGGTAFGTQPVVAVQDAGGNTVTASVAAVTLSITTPAGATLSCTSTVTVAAVAGVATFAGCKIDKAATYTLTAASGSLAAGTSGSVVISVGPAAKIAFASSPSNSARTVVFTTQPVVTIQDAGGNTVVTGTGSIAAVTLSITTPAGAILTCTANPKLAISGVATFGGCKIDIAGTYTLTASAAVIGFTAPSVAFTIT